MPTQLPDAAAATGASETEAQFKTFIQNIRAALAEMGDPLGMYGVIQNLALALSVAGNALTIAVKNRGLADPDGTAGSELPVSVPFRNATSSAGDFSVFNLTAASSLVISSGSTLGTLANVPFRLWIVAFNDAGTWRIGVINCVSAATGAGAGTNISAIYPLKGWVLASSTAEGGVGGADSAQTFYTGVAVTSKPYVVLGYATWESGLATPGTWSAGPTRIQLYGPGVPLPGDIIQVQRNDTGAVATGTTTIPFDDTIPQNTEGDQYMTQAITPTSAVNVLTVETEGNVSHSSASARVIGALFQDTTANALAAKESAVPQTGNCTILRLVKQILAATTSSTTFKLRVGSNSAGTITFNGSAGARTYGGVANSFMEVREVMG